ncbi:MAG: kinase, partial [Muribaculaceae bacterium]|nr:kinase [Muribaculaceae bacterium]
DKQSLYMWHVSRLITPNEKINPEDKKPVGDFHFHKGKWILINRRLPDMWEITENGKRHVKPGEYVELTEGKKILLSSEEGGRLIVVQLVNS